MNVKPLQLALHDEFPLFNSILLMIISHIFTCIMFTVLFEITSVELIIYFDGKALQSKCQLPFLFLK